MPSPPPSLILSPLPSRDAPPSDTWFPYRNGGDFDANLAMILIILFSALLAALALNAVIRCYFCRSPDSSSATGKMAVAPPVLPTLVFSAEMMKTAGGEAECAICLSEFVDGEGVRVLPRCKHAFHGKCIEGWLASRLSCPTCRTTCLTLSPEKNPAPPEVLPEP
ncbi:RING-H2 finger protein ATL79-like protein [Cinnamomum micranthum f. kanehirae]|uniref:RING-H2 finger protein ATL79-like protein n=1 Tax=Cinnamomum micranthum f. kanehirae TaxID=337451 RepID=A0A3S3QRU7_9MAGN|nr:RING-H2 finger protein ATL79-like protein [Cinnamomum micranthum f. kanehirae]